MKAALSKRLYKKLEALEAKADIMQDLLSVFDWKIQGNYALTGTCTRLIDEQIEILKKANIYES